MKPVFKLNVEFDEEKIKTLIQEYIQKNDIVPVVRCRDCKYRDEDKKCKHDANNYTLKFAGRVLSLNDCQEGYLIYSYVDDEHFCSYGELKDENNK